MTILEQKITVTTAGDAGSATGTGSTELPLAGFLLGFRVNYHASAPATTDVTITATLPSDYPALTLLTITDSSTDIPYRPVRIADYTPANVATTFFSKIPVQGHHVAVAVAGCDALTNAVVIFVIYEKED